LDAHVGALHIAVAGRERGSTAEDQIHIGCCGIAYASPGLRLKAAAAKVRIGRRTYKIATVALYIERRGGGGLSIHRAR
jgi:hypothetical protein